jgi:hypothetical protein
MSTSEFLAPDQRALYAAAVRAGLAEIGKTAAPANLPPLIARIRDDNVCEIQNGADFRTHDRVTVKVGAVTFRALYLRMEHAAEHGAAFEDAPPNHDVLVLCPLYVPRST